MRVAIIGGKLQGIETCYLAHRAAWEVVVIDKDPFAPARGLCEDFVCKDIVREPEKLVRAIRDVDLIIPAMEDLEGLQCLAEVAARSDIPLAFDPNAYVTTSSKKESDHLFYRLGLPAPRPWPDCLLPVIVKPAASSGSKGVMKIDDREALNVFLQKNKPNLPQWIVQEYLEGPSYSLEVIGLGGQCITLQPTTLEMDATFDCKRVIAPVDISAALDQEFRAIASTLAQKLHLNGVMDLEVIHHEDHLKILEIDARLPSQTPTVVERSTGINMLELLREVFLDSRLPEICPTVTQRGVVYEHIRVWGDHLEVTGEHIMAEAGPLRMEDDFFGADTALTNFSSPGRPWVATLIVSDTCREGAWEKRCGVIRAIMEACKLSRYEDPVPNDRGAFKGDQRDASQT
jgi:pyrrolysine biosynthesis protein PylC